MQIHTTIPSIRKALRGKNGTLGLVPTMGALHAGHLSLVVRARAENLLTVASIFVNPLQFGANEDLGRYPRTFEEDCAQLEAAAVDHLFAPTLEQMYPGGATTVIDPGPIATRLDGASRPGHFVGVATVVAKLFHIVQPVRAYFGQKDAAQLAVLRQIVRDLDFSIELVACPIVRDADGLALSSRNRYLSPEERAQALLLPRTLVVLAQSISAGQRDRKTLLALGHDGLRADPRVLLDYLELVDADTLLPLPEATGGALIAIAAKVGTTRLIDNFLVDSVRNSKDESFSEGGAANSAD